MQIVGVTTNLAINSMHYTHNVTEVLTTTYSQPLGFTVTTQNWILRAF